MDNTYTITIKNDSLEPQSFLLFQGVPEPANIPRDNVFTNVYQRAVKVAGNAQGSAMFEMSSDVYALYGTSIEREDGTVEVRTSSYREVKLGPNGSRVYLTTVDKDGVRPKLGMGDHSTEAEGAFVFSADESFSTSNPDNVYFGVGADVPYIGKVFPVQTYKARPNIVAHVFPKAKYYVAFGDYQLGTIVDLKTLGDVLSIDFTGCDEPSATFTLDDRHVYIPDPDVNANGIKWKVGRPL